MKHILPMAILISVLFYSRLNIGEQFTMIDTPGFGDNMENEEKTIDELVEVLKNHVR